MKDKTKEKVEWQTKTMVMISYMGGVSEAPRRVLRRSRVAVAMKSRKTLKQLLVHPTNKRSPQEAAGVAYSIPRKDCDYMYVGKTGRRCGVGEKEHYEGHGTTGGKEVY